MTRVVDVYVRSQPHEHIGCTHVVRNLFHLGSKEPRLLRRRPHLYCFGIEQNQNFCRGNRCIRWEVRTSRRQCPGSDRHAARGESRRRVACQLRRSTRAVYEIRVRRSSTEGGRVPSWQIVVRLARRREWICEDLNAEEIDTWPTEVGSLFNSQMVYAGDCTQHVHQCCPAEWAGDSALGFTVHGQQLRYSICQNRVCDRSRTASSRPAEERRRVVRLSYYTVSGHSTSDRKDIPIRRRVHSV